MPSPLIREQVSLAPYTTFGIGGPARFLAEAASEPEVLDALGFADARALPVFVLGGGSNLLVSDRGFGGVVVRVALSGMRLPGEPGVVESAAGEPWEALVDLTVGRGWAGLECLSGIPGTVGGAPIQNIGAYGQELSEVLLEVRALDRQARTVTTLDRAACGFGYRRSIFNTSAAGRYVVLGITCALRPGGPGLIAYPDLKRQFPGAGAAPLAAVRAAVRAIRASKSMLIAPGDPNAASAGSFFKNPVVPEALLPALAEAAAAAGGLSPGESPPHYPAPDARGIKVPAAWLIERAGFQKGYGRGRAGISSRHTLALVNRGGATAREILALAREIRDRVAEVFGVWLEPEPVLLGFEDAGGAEAR